MRRKCVFRDHWSRGHGGHPLRKTINQRPVLVHLLSSAYPAKAGRHDTHVRPLDPFSHVSGRRILGGAGHDNSAASVGSTRRAQIACSMLRCRGTHAQALIPLPPSPNIAARKSTNLQFADPCRALAEQAGKKQRSATSVSSGLRDYLKTHPMGTRDVAFSSKKDIGLGSEP